MSVTGVHDESRRAQRNLLTFGNITGNDPETNLVDYGNPLPVNDGGPLEPNGTQNNIIFQDASVAKNGGTSTDDTVVTSGQDYYVEKLQGGGFSAEGKVELWFGTPAANEVGMTLLGVHYLGIDSEEKTIKEQVTGDGTKVLRIKLTNNDTKDAEMFGRIVGFDVT